MNVLRETTPVQWALTAAVAIAIAAAIYIVADMLMDDGSGDSSIGISFDGSDGAETQLIPVRRGDLINSVAVNGSLEYSNRQELFFGIPGAVGEVFVEEGDKVSEGDVLARLDDESTLSSLQKQQEALVALQDAEKALAELLEPAAHPVAEAELKILEAEQSITDEEAVLKESLNAKLVDIEAARVKVAETRKAEEAAVEALNELLETDKSDVIDAELAVLEAEQSLENALADLESEPIDAALKISQAESDLAAARLELHNIEESLIDAQRAADPEEVKDIELKITHAEKSFEDALDKLRMTELQTAAKIEDAEMALNDAHEEYEAVFMKWLGLDISAHALMIPDSLFEAFDIDLDSLFVPREPDELMESDGGLRAFNLEEDDPGTPWNESLIDSWVVFYPGQLFVECEHLSATSSRLCVRREFDDAWKPIPDLLEALTVVELEASSELRQAQETLARADEELDDLEDQLTELQEPTDNVVISDLLAKQGLALNRVEEASDELARAKDEMLPSEGGARLSLLVAQTEVEVARNALSEARAHLADLRAGATDSDIAASRAEAELARAEFQEAQEALAELTTVDDHAVAVSQQKLIVLHAQLDNARQDLNDLLNPDAAALALRRAEVATARENYESAQVADNDSVVVAPFDGIVSKSNVSIGQSVNAETAAFEIADPAIVQIVGTVDEIDVLYLQAGDAASITLEALGDEPLAGRVAGIAAFGESQQGVVTYPVTIQTEPPAGAQLPEGLSAVAEIVIREERDVLLAPIQALVGSVNEPQVLVVDAEGRIASRNVVLGISDDFWTVIESGVSEGETISMTVVGSDTSQFGGFRAFGALGGRPPGGR